VLNKAMRLKLWSKSNPWPATGKAPRNGPEPGLQLIRSTQAITQRGTGSALVENLVQEGFPVMTSVYHLDGGDLRMTHFCGAQNQPRLKADQIDLPHGLINFGFVDITNLRSPDAAHVHGMEMRLVDSNHITITFLFQSGGKESRERIDLKRSVKKS
jgi:hypothetical protein